MIFDGMLRNLDNVSGKFLMYPRSIQTFLDKQLDGLPTHKEKYDVSFHTKKVFAIMKRIGKGFSGKETPLFPTMGRIDKIDIDEDIALVSTHDDVVQDKRMEDVVSAVETIVTIAPTITAKSAKINIKVTQAPKRKGVMIQEPKKTTTTKIASSQQPQVWDKEKRKKFFAAKRTTEKKNKPPTKAQQRSIMSTYLKNMDGWKPRALKHKSFTETKELFDKAMKRINNFINFKTELVEKVEDDKESEELKKCLKIIPDDGDEVTMDAIPLSSKSPTIVDYKIYKEGKKNYFKSFRADGNSQMYLTFSKVLKIFDREDLEVLWRLFKDIFVKTKPMDNMDSFLLHTLNTMFKHHVEDNVWKNQQGLTKVKNWKLYDSCGAHCVTMQNILYYLLVEKMYPLTNHILHQMFNNVKLQVDDEFEMAYELFRLVKKHLKEGYVPQ
uniref:Uncharacterized protein n=1 Tax=Tanacetum cinerariifolium TaxID=118510 RepID=A0A6L2LNR9_TANCI|nr:hypothetical protein [Tanacetum cinerariifolium]